MAILTGTNTSLCITSIVMGGGTTTAYKNEEIKAWGGGISNTHMRKSVLCNGTEQGWKRI